MKADSGEGRLDHYSEYSRLAFGADDVDGKGQLRLADVQQTITIWGPNDLEGTSI